MQTPESGEQIRYTLEELMEKVDMEQLKQFNPKLAAQIENDPNLLLEL